jgi:tetratricopeptide (TPR) repeat protein
VCPVKDEKSAANVTAAPYQTSDFNASEFKPLSQSPLWKFQQDFYKKLGMDAWRPQQVPNFITTNSFIAHRYARVIAAMIRDWCLKHGNKDEPVNILELGAGSGRFAHFFLHHIKQALSELSVSQPFRYVMTDISEANINFWRQHEKLAPFVTSGELDFAYFDASEQCQIDLMESGTCLKTGSGRVPIIVIANYLIDTLPSDLFQIRNGELHQRLAATRIDDQEPDIQKVLDQTFIAYKDAPCPSDWYGDDHLKEILEGYIEGEKDFGFAVPIGFIRSLETLKSFTSGPLFVLASDFGPLSKEAMQEHNNQIQVVMNKAYTVPANFDFIGRLSEKGNGIFLKPACKPSAIATVGYLFGNHDDAYPNLLKAYQDYIDDFSPDDFNLMKEVLEAPNETLDLKHMMSFLRLSQFDSRIFLMIFDQLNAAVPMMKTTEREYLKQAIHSVITLFYRADQETDIHLQCGHLLGKMGEYQDALRLFEISASHFGLTAKVQYLMSILYWEVGQKEDAVQCLKEALNKEPDFTQATERLRLYQAQIS